MCRSLLPGLALLALGSAPASAQFLNRAVWLGAEEEPFRRDYDQSPDYFLTRWSYVDAPPWWRGDSLDPFANRLDVMGGSVSSKRLTLEAVGNAGIEMGDGFVGRLNYLQSENQTTQFERVAVGIDKRLSDATAMFLQMEGTPDKSRADASLGLELFRGDTSAHRLMFTLVDFPHGKSDEFRYERQPYGILLAGYAGDPRRFEFDYEIGTQLPFEEQRVDEAMNLSMNRTIGTLEGRLRLDERDRLIFGLDGELTDKELRPEDPATPGAENGNIAFGRLRSEWWHRGEGGREYSLGAYWLHDREEWTVLDGSAPNADVKRSEAMLFTRAHLKLRSAWSLEPYVIGGLVDLKQTGLAPFGDEDFEGFQGKLGLPLRFDFSAHAWIRFDLGFQLDELAFGGGGVQLVASF